jgi:site-specific DNA recombinase
LVNGRLHQIVARRKALEHTLATTQAQAPRQMPNLADTYHAKVVELSAALSADNAEAAREQARGLVEAIVPIPEEDDLRIEVRGELGAILRLGSGANTNGPAGLLRLK